MEALWRGRILVRDSPFSIQGEIFFCDDFIGEVEAMASVFFSC
jgi:hypothetical protein